MLGNQIVSGNLRNDYSYISVANTSGTSLIARCVTGLGPNSTDDNNVLGGFYFNGNQIPNGNCDPSTTIKPRGAPISEVVGVMDLHQCDRLTPSEEGVYTCTMITSSMMYQSMRLGVYIPGRSKCTYVCMHVHMEWIKANLI